MKKQLRSLNEEFCLRTEDGVAYCRQKRTEEEEAMVIARVMRKMQWVVKSFLESCEAGLLMAMGGSFLNFQTCSGPAHG